MGEALKKGAIRTFGEGYGASMKYFLFGLCLLPSICSPVFAEKLTFKFTRTGSGGGGGTILWQGVVVDVEDNKVSPRYTVHNRVFFSKWSDYPATAIQACERDDDGFSSNNSCIVSKESVIAIPLNKSPYEYSYKFLFTRKNEAKSEESFILDKESLLQIKQRKVDAAEENSSHRSR